MKRALSTFLRAGNRLKQALGRGNPVTRGQSDDEVYFWNLDMYGPEFRHLHAEPEVRDWFAALGFVDVVQQDRMVYGYGLTGDLPA